MILWDGVNLTSTFTPQAPFKANTRRGFLCLYTPITLPMRASRDGFIRRHALPTTLPNTTMEVSTYGQLYAALYLHVAITSPINSTGSSITLPSLLSPLLSLPPHPPHYHLIRRPSNSMHPRLHTPRPRTICRPSPPIQHLRIQHTLTNRPPLRIPVHSQ